MIDTLFERLNKNWNAEPNAPDEMVSNSGTNIELHFTLNPFAYVAFEDERAKVTFHSCSKWRLGSTNDEGWYRGQCRYSGIAPKWGEFYEVLGVNPLKDEPSDWKLPEEIGSGERHFLFYLRDSTFECFASNWKFTRFGNPYET